MIRFCSLIICLLLTACGSNNLLKEVKTSAYPSASGIEYYKDHYYIIGDDAKTLQVLDEKFDPIDSITLYPFAGKRIPKPQKADLEAITVTADNKLLLAGSGSLAPTRNMAWLIDPVTRQKESIRLDTFYQRLLSNGIREINIEGLCAIPGAMLLTNRGNKAYPKNFLILTSPTFWKNQSHAPITLIHAGSGNDSNYFNGVSGLAYAKKSDRLVMTVSTEDTHNNQDDGAIGNSYLWLVGNISAKESWKAINPDKIINLTEVDKRFKGQKIESVCVIKETGNFLHLALVADNDDGSSTLFKLVVEKN